MSVGGCLRFFEEVESVSDTSSAAAVAAAAGVAVVVVAAAATGQSTLANTRKHIASDSIMRGQAAIQLLLSKTDEGCIHKRRSSVQYKPIDDKSPDIGMSR